MALDVLIALGVSLPSQMAEQGTICMRTNLCGLPWWLSGEESVCQCRRCGLNPWVRKIPWRRKWQPSSVFLPGKSHGQRSLAGYSSWGLQELDMTQQGNGNSLQYSCLENPVDRAAYQATDHGVAKSQTRLSDFTSLQELINNSNILTYRYTYL